MPWFYIAVALVLSAFAWWLVNTRNMFPQQIRTVVNIVVVATCVFILKAVGLWDDVVRLWNNAVHSAHHSDRP